VLVSKLVKRITIGPGKHSLIERGSAVVSFAIAIITLKHPSQLSRAQAKFSTSSEKPGRAATAGGAVGLA
jgi:hypothetical protein